MVTYAFTLSGRLLYQVGQELETKPSSTWDRKLAVLVASAQKELGTAVARTTAMDWGMVKSSMSWLESVSAGAAMAMLAKSTAARDLNCIVAVCGG